MPNKLWSFAAVLSLACASGQAEPATSDSSGSPDAEKDTEMEAQRKPFVETCMQRASAPDYCECAFEQFAVVFRGADLNQQLREDDPRLEELQKKTITNCASLVNEDQVKTHFLAGCVGDEPKKRAYCECAWPALREHLSLPEFLGSAESLRFHAAKRKMTIACKGKFPVDVAKGEFMEGCRKEKASEPSCSCLWKKVSARFSVEEIAAGSADLSSMPELAECRDR